MWVSAALMCSFLFYFTTHFVLRGHAVAQMVEALHYKPDSIPDGVVGIFHGHNPSSLTVVLEFTQPITEINTSNILWGGKGGRCLGLTTLPPSCVNYFEIWEH
jgi:hypothetical protein